MSLKHLSVVGLRWALVAGIQRVIAQRDELNRINVFPVADGDTGTNLAFTLGAVLHGLGTRRFERPQALVQWVAAEVGDAARGNSGAIAANFFHGTAEALAQGRLLTPSDLARAAAAGSSRARAGMAVPREGTMLSVMQAFADAMQARAGEGVRDFRVCFEYALQQSRMALRQTTGQLKELRAAGVVDAGGSGFVALLEGVADYIDRGRGALSAMTTGEISTNGIDAVPATGDNAEHRHCVTCMVSGERVDRAALKAALLTLPLSRLVIAGSRSRVRVHAHLSQPADFLAIAARFGAVSREQTVDWISPSPVTPRSRVAIVTDSGADLPEEAVDRLDLHVVPQRISIGGRDFIDGVSITPPEFYDAMRISPMLPRTSQPPPGDFRRMFEFLLDHHERVIDVSVSRTLSGTIQSAAGAAARAAPGRVTVFDSGNVSAGQSLLAIWAAEAARAGLDEPGIVAGLTRMRTRTWVFGLVRDVRYGVRGGRVPRVALSLTRWLRFSLMVRSRPNGRLGLMGGLWGQSELPERFARKVARRLDPARRYRLIVSHCDCEADGRRMQGVLQTCVRAIDSVWLVDASIAIGAHAGPGSLVIGVQDYEPPVP